MSSSKPPIKRNGRTYEYEEYYGRYVDRNLEYAHPGILCGECAHDTFQAAYGDYELVVKCTKCGNEQTVYDG